MELLKREFSDVPTERLFDLLVKCFAILKTETENAAVFSEEGSILGIDDLTQDKSWTG